MDEDKNQELPELDLEAILKEFGGGDTEEPAQTEAPVEPEETTVTQETVRIETETVAEVTEAPAESKPEASVTGDTVRLEHVEDLREEVQGGDPCEAGKSPGKTGGSLHRELGAGI